MKKSFNYKNFNTQDWPLPVLRNIANKLGFKKIPRNKMELYNKIYQIFVKNKDITIQIDIDTCQNTVDTKKPEKGLCPIHFPYKGTNLHGDICCFKKREYKLGDKKEKYGLRKKVVKHEKHDQLLRQLLERSAINYFNNNYFSADSRSKKLFPSTRRVEEKYFDQKDFFYKPMHLKKVLPTYNLVFYDLETTGLIVDSNMPDITQIVIYKPLQNKILNQYVRPTKQIDQKAAEITGIYDTFKYGDTVLTKTDIYKQLLNSRKKEIQMSMDKYDLDVKPEIHKEIVEELRKDYGIVSFENEKTFDKHIEKIYSFIQEKKDITFMIAHNGLFFDEPILKHHFKKNNKQFYLDDIVFIDTYDFIMYSAPVKWTHKLENLYNDYYEKYRNEKRLTKWHDAETDVRGLWYVVKSVFLEIWDRNDNDFIIAKLIEYYYQSQLDKMNQSYIKKVAPFIFKTKES